MTPHAYVFADGSCGKGDDFGAWAAVAATVNSHKLLLGSMWPTTISRCELMPIIEGLRWVKKSWARQPGFRVTVVSDSEYTVKTLTGLYTRRRNKDLWAAVDAAASDMQIQYVWRERNSLPYMTICDAICGAYRKALIGATEERFGAGLAPELSFPRFPLPESMADNTFDPDDLDSDTED